MMQVSLPARQFLPMVANTWLDPRLLINRRASALCAGPFFDRLALASPPQVRYKARNSMKEPRKRVRAFFVGAFVSGDDVLA